MGRVGYGLVTSHRWLWPLVQWGAVLLFGIQEAVLKHEARKGRL